MALAVRRSRAVLTVFVVVALAAAAPRRRRGEVVAGTERQGAHPRHHAVDERPDQRADPGGDARSRRRRGDARAVGGDDRRPTSRSTTPSCSATTTAPGSNSADVLAAPLANLATWVPAVSGNIFFSTSDAVYHANEGNNESGATLQITKGLAYAAGAGTTGFYFTSCVLRRRRLARASSTPSRPAGRPTARRRRHPRHRFGRAAHGPRRRQPRRLRQLGAPPDRVVGERLHRLRHRHRRRAASASGAANGRARPRPSPSRVRTRRRTAPPAHRSS